MHHKYDYILFIFTGSEPYGSDWVFSKIGRRSADIDVNWALDRLIIVNWALDMLIIINWALDRLIIVNWALNRLIIVNWALNRLIINNWALDRLIIINWAPGTLIFINWALDSLIFYLTLIVLRLFQKHYCYNVTGQSQESEGSYKPAGSED